VKVLAATRSVGKQAEIRRVLGRAGLEVVFPDDIWLRESSAGDPLEQSDSFEANARQKAEYFARLSSMPTFADDSGLEVFSLGGAPGAHSKRWAGAAGSEAEIDAANNAELLRRLADAPESRRLARYRCVLFYLPSYGAVPTICQGDCTGRILDAPRGTNGFGYDPYFFSDELGKTFGEATDKEKDAVSHRGRALRALAERLARRERPSSG
jgi:XTP/dITP diphosphohydrolase